MDWTDISDILRAALAFFLVVSAVGIAWVCIKLGSVLGALAGSVRRMTDETVPILTRAQTTVDGVNLQLTRVDDIMVSAVGATKGAEKAVGSVASAVAAPARSVSGMAARVQEQVKTFQARRQARKADPATAPARASDPRATGACGGALARTCSGRRRRRGAGHGLDGGHRVDGRRRCCEGAARGGAALSGRACPSERLALMRLSAPALVAVAAYAAVRAVGSDPRRWPAETARLADDLRADWAEAGAAGRRAESRARRRLDRDIARAAEGLSQ